MIPQEWWNEDHLAQEEVVVVLVDKFGLCWCGDFPPAFTCSSQVSLRIPSSTTMTMNRILSIMLIPISTTDAAFSSFPNWFSKKRDKRKPRKIRRIYLNAWLDLQERELCIIYMKEKILPFSKPLPDRIPQQQQWLYLSCSPSNYNLLHQPVRWQQDMYKFAWSELC